MADKHIGRIVVYGACFALAVAAGLIWPQSPYPFFSMGVFGIRLLDALWGDNG